MGAELKEKLAVLDHQISTQREVYRDLINAKRTPYGIQWDRDGREREREILLTISDIQDTKRRLISGEKIPDIIYVDKEVPEYITTKNITVIKSGFASGFMGASFVVYILLAAAYVAKLFTVSINL